MAELAREKVDLASVVKLKNNEPHWFVIAALRLFVCETLSSDETMEWVRFLSRLEEAGKVYLTEQATGGVCVVKIYAKDAYLVLVGGGYAVRGVRDGQFETAVRGGVEVFDPR